MIDETIPVVEMLLDAEQISLRQKKTNNVPISCNQTIKQC